MLKNQRGWFLQSYELLPLLGVPAGGHLPKEGFGPVEVQGVRFMCRPALAPRLRPDGRIVKVSRHRLVYLCEACQKWIPTGRAYQHRKGRVHKNNAVNGGSNVHV